MTATNAVEACLCEEELADEFSRLAASTPASDIAAAICIVSGLVKTQDDDGVICPLMLRRHLLVPASPLGV